MARHVLVLFAVAIWLATPAWVWPQPKSDGQERVELVTAMRAAKVSLEQGLAASAGTGTPISAKFEVEDGRLQLSVYTMKADKFSEVVVDRTTGKVAKTEPITGGEDLTHAQQQGAAMGQAKRSLQAAATSAVKANPGFRAASVFPALKEGHPVAEVALVKGAEWKVVSEKLD